MARTPAVPLIVVALLMLPAQAGASVVASYQDGVVTVTAGPGNDNINVVPWADTIQIQSWADGIQAGPGCSGGMPSDTVTCPAADKVYAELGDGDDWFQMGSTDGPSTVDWEVHAGSGDDHLSGGGHGDVTAYGDAGADTVGTDSGNDVLYGGPGTNNLRAGNGNDRIYGGDGIDIVWGEDGDDYMDGGAGLDELFGGNSWAPGNTDVGHDVLIGGDGPDYLDGEGGPDEMYGGAGVDRVRYLSATTGITASLDGHGPDGAPGENDVIGGDVEDLEGGPGDDTLIGDDGPNYLSGADGADHIVGGGGADVIQGFAGADAIDAGAGDDYVEAGLDPDTVDGGPGVDKIMTQEGADHIESRDGETEAELDCGSGTDDSAVVDDADKTVGCETTSRPSGTTTTPPPPPVDGSWGEGRQIGGKGAYAGNLVMTSSGDAIAAWSEERYENPLFGIPVRAIIQPAGGAPALAFDLDPAGSGSQPQLVRAGKDDVLVLWFSASGPVQFAERKPGEDHFSAPVDLGNPTFSPILTANRAGDAALVWYDWHGKWVARIRPYGGTWSDPFDVTGPGVAEPWHWTAALTDKREVVAAWVDYIGNDNRTWPIHAASRAEGAEPGTPTLLSAYGNRWTQLQLDSDAAGNTVAVWNEQRDWADYADGPTVASKPPGSPFGPRISMPAGEYAFFGLLPHGPGIYYPPPAPNVVVADDGYVTISYPAVVPIGCDGFVFSGPNVSELALEHRFALNMCNSWTALAKDPAGRVMTAWDADGDHGITSERAPGGSLGAVQDLRPECDHADDARIALGPDGTAAALIWDAGRQFLAFYKPFTGDGRQVCLPHELYRPGEERDPKPSSAEPPPIERVAPYAPARAVAGLTRGMILRSLKVTGRGARRLITAKLTCDRCQLTGSATLQNKRRRAVASGRRSLRSSTGEAVLRVRLHATKVRAGRGHKLLRLRISARSADGAVMRRAYVRRLKH